MKNIKSFLKKIDVFGVPYLFRYKTKDKYANSLGGLVNIIFTIFVISFTIYYFVPFATKKNFTTIYYSNNIPHAELINLGKSNSPFALGIIYENDTNILSQNLFEFNIKYISVNNHQGNYNKNILDITTHKCSYNDFNNEQKKYFNKLNLGNYQCLDKNDFSIEGSYSDEKYSFYEINLKSKLSSENINTFLQNNECKIHFVYADININLNNYKNPIKSFLNSFYINIESSNIIIKNIYFMKQYFFNDNYLFSIYNKDNTDYKVYSTFSRYEQYSYNKDKNINEDELIYAKIYLKSDTRNIYIKRKYQKFIEFFADISSIFVCIFSLLSIIINNINNFFAKYALEKKIFLFKDVYKENFDFKKKVLKIRQLITLTEPYSSNKSEAKFDNQKEEKNDNDNNIEIDVEELEIYKIKNEILKDFYKSEIQSIKGNTDRDATLFKRNNRRVINNNNFIHSNKNFSFNNKVKSFPKEIHKSAFSKKILKPYESSSMTKDNNTFNQNFGKEILSNNMSSERNAEIKKDEYNISPNKNKINYKYTFLDMINISLCKCCISNNLKIKSELNAKASQILFNKMDIIVFIRNMFLLDIIMQIIFDVDKKYIANFISRPIISSKEVNESEFNEFYQKYDETEFIKSTLGIYKLLKIERKKNSEQKLIALCNKQLKDML